MDNKIRLGINILATTIIVVWSLYIFPLAYGIINSALPLTDRLIYIGLEIILLMPIIGAIELFSLKNWARILSLAFAWVSFLYLIVIIFILVHYWFTVSSLEGLWMTFMYELFFGGLAALLSPFELYYLTRPKVKALFSPTKPMAKQEAVFPAS